MLHKQKSHLSKTFQTDNVCFHEVNHTIYPPLFCLFTKTYGDEEMKTKSAILNGWVFRGGAGR